jgi:aspartate beta-hydroxylase
MKREYESLVSKQRVDFRDFEGKKKKEMEDLDRLRNEELEKLRKEKKALEQRSKNMQLVQTSNKKEREEIEYLKRELLRVQEEGKARDVKAKTQIERLTKQCDEYKQRNKEL